VIEALVLFDLRVLGWAVLHLAWQGMLLLVASALSLRLMGNASPVARERVAGFALAALVFLFVVAALRAFAHAFEIGPEQLAPVRGVTLDMVTPFLGGAWLTGMLFALVRLAVGAFEALRLHRGPRLPVDAPVPVFASADVQAPALVGFLSPANLAPSVPERSILLHELAHHARGDAWGNLAARVAHALLWFHPASWWLVAQLDILRELACDDMAAREAGAADLARALLALERSRVPGLGPWLGANGAPLVERVRRLAAPGRPARGGPWAACAMLLALAWAFVALPQAGGPCLPEEVGALHHVRPHLEGPFDHKRIVRRDVLKT
jgi:D-alanyl-D-alanine endopeptidase (penicillin-binding protein 7)